MLKSSKARFIFAAMLLCLLLGWALVNDFGPKQTTPTLLEKGAAATPERNSIQPVDSVTDSKAQRTALEFNLMGTKVDAGRLFEIGFGGGLIVNAETKVALDILNSALPEEPSQDDLAHVDSELRKNLPPHEAGEAIALFNSYRGYLNDVRSELTPLGIPQTRQAAKEFFDRLERIQSRHFDKATEAALLGPHPAIARYSMESAFIEQDHTLSDSEKQAQLLALRERLPKNAQLLLTEQTASTPIPEAESPTRRQ